MLENENQKEIAVLLSKIDDLLRVVGELKVSVKEIDGSLRVHEIKSIEQLVKLTNISEQLEQRVSEIRKDVVCVDKRVTESERVVYSLEQDIGDIKKALWWGFSAAGSAIIGIVVTLIKQFLQLP